ELWQRVQRELVEDEPATTPDLLERGFGIALLERALIDAMCRHAGAGFAEARRSGLLGREFDWPATRPRQRIAVRHTVGRLDPLRSSDIAPAERVADGMPQALDEVLEQHGVRWLKVKIGGGLTDDVARLVEIGLLLGELGRDDVRVTLDGNEQFADFEELDRLWVETAANPHGEGLLRRVLWVEQPLPRARSLGDGAARWQRCPLVLDEADAQRRTFEQSGCDGVSVKNCKGVFRALLNAELASKQPGRFQSSEDLTNLPVLSVQQDLVTAAVLELPHSERNGHHYFPGLDHLPPAVVEAALAAHGDLYVATDSGAKLRIEGGEIAIGSLFGTGYGCDQSVVDALDRALDWRPA
ncbi:MAG: hypothetical protein KDE27_27545, partial [Planctomycetes bacterium]|nr:hypothetical protein [Planctomycetota bacterium]